MLTCPGRPLQTDEIEGTHVQTVAGNHFWTEDDNVKTAGVIHDAVTDKAKEAIGGCHTEPNRVTGRERRLFCPRVNISRRIRARWAE
ncbi:hypothetical protein SprV_0902668600 [Sparganum proliferum]